MDKIGAGTGVLQGLIRTTNLTLGPDSAGCLVGVCYPEGGIETVTVSDCHVVFG